MFAELHWKKDVIHKIEDLVIPDENSVPMQRSEEEGVIKTIRARNIYYMKCRGTVDEYISRMLYRKDRALWESLEHLQLAQLKNLNKDKDTYQVPIRIKEVKVMLASLKDSQYFMNGNANYAQGDISATAKSFEFQYPPT